VRFLEDTVLLHESHIKLLKEISKHPISRNDPHGVEDLKYLHDLGLIVVVSFPSKDDYYFGAYRLTEKGKAYLSSLRAEKLEKIRNRVSFYIAVAAFLLSVLAAFTPFPDWFRSFVESLFT
jgi:hypothetical protein